MLKFLRAAFVGVSLVLVSPFAMAVAVIDTSSAVASIADSQASYILVGLAVISFAAVSMGINWIKGVATGR